MGCTIDTRLTPQVQQSISWFSYLIHFMELGIYLLVIWLQLIKKLTKG
jgi:hypothetical protein